MAVAIRVRAVALRGSAADAVNKGTSQGSRAAADMTEAPMVRHGNVAIAAGPSARTKPAVDDGFA